mmetsp:Transcript_4956/g.14371  ORF Transcript_4956/g.14371 Transcript_4956/m.14371 type:complete len:177 (-) Transcript_4956:304-834(-)
MALVGRQPPRTTRSRTKSFRLSTRTNLFWWWCCISLALVAFALVLHQALAVSLRSSAMASNSNSPVFSLLVTANFDSVEHKDEFLKDFGPYAQYVKTHEPTTLAYEVLLSDKDPLQVLILERYQDKDHAYLQVHRSSDEFQAFRPKLKAMQDQGFVTLSGHSYLDAGLGFGDRSGK